jgi:hypothetical protein
LKKENLKAKAILVYLKSVVTSIEKDGKCRKYISSLIFICLGMMLTINPCFGLKLGSQLISGI